MLIFLAPLPLYAQCKTILLKNYLTAILNYNFDQVSLSEQAMDLVNLVNHLEDIEAMAKWLQMVALQNFPVSSSVFRVFVSIKEMAADEVDDIRIALTLEYW